MFNNCNRKIIIGIVFFQAVVSDCDPLCRVIKFELNMQEVLTGKKVDIVPNIFWHICILPSNRTDTQGALILARLLHLCKRHGTTKVYCTTKSLSNHFRFTADQIRRILERLRATKYIVSQRDKAGWHIEPQLENIQEAIDRYNKKAPRHSKRGDTIVKIPSNSTCIRETRTAKITSPYLANLPDGDAGIPFKPLSEVSSEEFKSKTQVKLTLEQSVWYDIDTACDVLTNHVKILSVKQSNRWPHFFRKVQRARKEDGLAIGGFGQKIELHQIDPMLILEALLASERIFSSADVLEVAITLKDQRKALQSLCLGKLPDYRSWRREWIRSTSV